MTININTGEAQQAHTWPWPTLEVIEVQYSLSIYKSMNVLGPSAWC